MANSNQAIVFDNSIWYHLSEARVGLSNALQNYNNRTVIVYETDNMQNPENFWQIIRSPQSNSTFTSYYLRCRDPGPDMALSVCFDPNDVSEQSKTGACLSPTDPNSSAQQWTFERWPTIDTSTYRIKNVGNGTEYNLSVQKGNPIYMTTNLKDTPYDPGQHWLIAEMGGSINDATYSSIVQGSPTEPTSSPVVTTMTSITTATANTSTTESHDTASKSLSTGAWVGIAVAIVVFIFLCVAALYVVIRHRRRAAAADPQSNEKVVDVESSNGSKSESELMPVEAHGTSIFELDSSGQLAEMEDTMKFNV